MVKGLNLREITVGYFTKDKDLEVTTFRWYTIRDVIHKTYVID